MNGCLWPGYPGIQLIPLSLPILCEATRLPDGSRSDPADELIVATSRVLDAQRMTRDGALRAYPHVKLAV